MECYFLFGIMDINFKKNLFKSKWIVYTLIFPALWQYFSPITATNIARNHRILSHPAESCLIVHTYNFTTLTLQVTNPIQQDSSHIDIKTVSKTCLALLLKTKKPTRKLSTPYCSRSECIPKPQSTDIQKYLQYIMILPVISVR